MPLHHNIYVIRLDEVVLENAKFREQNPGYEPGKPCVYVGMTGRPVHVRFAQHRRGYKANRFAKRFGRYLMRRQFERLNPMTEAEARRRERWKAERLRRKGWAVWQN